MSEPKILTIFGNGEKLVRLFYFAVILSGEANTNSFHSFTTQKWATRVGTYIKSVCVNSWSLAFDYKLYRCSFQQNLFLFLHGSQFRRRYQSALSLFRCAWWATSTSPTHSTYSLNLCKVWLLMDRSSSNSTHWSSLWGKKSFYTVLNEILQKKIEKKLKPWFLYLKLVVSAFSNLSCNSERMTVFQGVKMDLQDQYPKGSTLL